MGKMKIERIELNHDGVNELLHEGMRSYVEEAAGIVMGRAGNGYGSRVVDMPTRTIAVVYADTDEAKADNLENNTLLRAIGG